jgi:hypothetical protein
MLCVAIVLILIPRYSGSVLGYSIYKVRFIKPKLFIESLKMRMQSPAKKIIIKMFFAKASPIVRDDVSS